MSIDKPLIEVHDLSFAYEQHPVLEHVSFSIKRGDYVGIVGPNGGGKTTLLKLLVGLLRPQVGTIHIAEGSHIGYVPQRVAQESISFPATVFEIVESGLTPRASIFHRTTAGDRTAIERALEIANIVDLKDRLMSGLSGGQRQRVYVARALVSKPDLLILDEPFVGVDVTTQQDFYAFLKNLNQTQGLTILFVSHDIDVVTEEVKSILCLNRGLLCFGSPSMLHEPRVIEHLYGKNITHIHRSH